jgi:formylglycine-generating enzyme required for sulfatase activity
MHANGYRLPTEVEWEYAASRGAAGAPEWMFPYAPLLADYDPDKQVDASTAAFTAKVGSKSPAGDTREGVADMTGNVSEWCSDNDDAFTPSVATDRYIFVTDDGSFQFMLRGGSIQDIANATNTARPSLGPATQQDGLGIRVVRTLP